MSIRVLIVDQHEIMRAGIKQACSARDDIEFAGEASSFEEGCRMARATNPDVAIIDPECDSVVDLDGIRRLHEEMPELKILVFTSNDGQDYAQQIMEAGASGYLIKVAGLDEIQVAIRLVHLGRIFISHTRQAVSTPKSNRAAPMTSAPASGHDHSAPIPSAQLSSREREVLALLGDGMTNKQAAEQLFLSVKTVETYRARIIRKYGLRDRAELVQFARKTIGEVAQPA